MYIDRLSDSSAVFGTGGVPDQPAPPPTDERAALMRSRAAAKAEAIRVAELVPAVREWIRLEILAARQAAAAGIAMARWAWAISSAGVKLPSPGVFDEVVERTRENCRGIVRCGILDRADEVFTDFPF